MIEYIKGKIIELTPTSVILETSGIGYRILISLQTYQALVDQTDSTIYIHHHLREDDEKYYGFATRDERELFELLISASKIGVVTAQIMLSTLTSEEIRQAIVSEDVNTIKSVKGIGVKSAQRLIIELKDKIVKGEGADIPTIEIKQNNETVEEATQALIMLGFAKPKIKKVIDSILKTTPNAKVEELIKNALQKL